MLRLKGFSFTASAMKVHERGRAQKQIQKKLYEFSTFPFPSSARADGRIMDSFLDSFWMAAAASFVKSNIVVVNAGGKQFPAPRIVLTSYSGYFRSVLAGGTGNIDLPTVPSEYFSILLAGMQMGGTFDGLLTISNVYQILLYSQLLQIPLAVASCRNFISIVYYQYATPTPTTTPTPTPILKPIPSKPFLPQLPEKASKADLKSSTSEKTFSFLAKSKKGTLINGKRLLPLL